MKYIKRLIDNKISEFVGTNIGILITGVKGCGKTETAKQFAKSLITIDDSDEMRTTLATRSEILLEGDKPKLIDEWQIYPWIFNKIRHAIDNKDGCFILTGSSLPINDKNIHSGAGRFVEFMMRPLTWYEMGYSNGQVSIDDIFANRIPKTQFIEIPIKDRISRLIIGGWPFLLNIPEAMKSKILKMYVDNVYKKDIRKLIKNKNSSKILERILKSLSRNISTPVKLTTIRNDINNLISLSALNNYYLWLERLFIMEDLPSWPTHIRSTASLRKAPKRYFVDPSIAISILGLSYEQLINDLKYTGLIFENEVIKNMRVYSESIGANLYYYDEIFTSTVNGKKQTVTKEVDLILEKPNGDWCAFEIKFGFNDFNIEKGVEALNNMMSHLDFTKIKKPCSLNIITSDGIAFKRPDGINIIPLCFLKGK